MNVDISPEREHNAICYMVLTSILWIGLRINKCLLLTKKLIRKKLLV
ncbi:Uncharacterised protein [Klebsiella pneumoniae]|nr:Uncharacterised protein [Klebsiella pneumoniae]